MGLKNKRADAVGRIEDVGVRREEVSEEERAEVYSGLKDQLFYCKRLRQNLETARLLMELVRKREKVKRDLVQVKLEFVFLRI